MVIVCVLLEPTATLPKETAFGTTAICGCTPVAESVTVVGELVAVLRNVKLPLDDPAKDGVNVTPIEVLCPEARLTGNTIPVAVKPVPAAVN